MVLASAAQICLLLTGSAQSVVVQRHETIGARGNFVERIFVISPVYDLPMPDFTNLMKTVGAEYDEKRTAGRINYKNNETGGRGDVRHVSPYVGVPGPRWPFHHGGYGARKKTSLRGGQARRSRFSVRH